MKKNLIFLAAFLFVTASHAQQVFKPTSSVQEPSKNEVQTKTYFNEVKILLGGASTSSKYGNNSSWGSLFGREKKMDFAFGFGYMGFSDFFKGFGVQFGLNMNFHFGDGEKWDDGAYKAPLRAPQPNKIVPSEFGMNNTTTYHNPHHFMMDFEVPLQLAYQKLNSKGTGIRIATGPLFDMIICHTVKDYVVSHTKGKYEKTSEKIDLSKKGYWNVLWGAELSFIGLGTGRIFLGTNWGILNYAEGDYKSFRNMPIYGGFSIMF